MELLLDSPLVCGFAVLHAVSHSELFVHLSFNMWFTEHSRSDLCIQQATSAGNINVVDLIRNGGREF
ncbi:hypothetical protein SUGI_0541270 [Cryptomeria japonica]|nr:hypothetical protein SUGI_0541270 [Cryptomeria japonica]